jgi:hypothetical protein
MLYHAVVVLFLFAAGGASSKSWILPLKSSFYSKAKSAVKKQRNRVLAFGEVSKNNVIENSHLVSIFLIIKFPYYSR